MMRWLKDKKKERRSNSVSYDDDGKEDDYGFEKERPRPASKSPSTRRQLPPTPAMPEEKSPHIYEEIPDMACNLPAPSSQQQASAEVPRKKNAASAAKKGNSIGKGGEVGVKGASGGGKIAPGNKYTSDVSAGGGGKASGPKKKRVDDGDLKGQYLAVSVDEQSRQTPPNMYRNGTPEVHCDVIIKDTHCEILLSRKPKNGGFRADCSNSTSSSSVVAHSDINSASQYPLPRETNSAWNKQTDGYVGPQSGRFTGQAGAPRDRRASVDVHSSSKFTSAFSLASSASSATPVIGNSSISSAGANNSGSTSFSSSTSRLNSIGASSSFSLLNFTEPYHQKAHPAQQNYTAQQRQQLKHQQNQNVYQVMQPPQGVDNNNGTGESAGSVSSSSKGIETYTTASNFIARPAILPFNPLPGAKDPCVEAFGRPLSTGSSSTDGAYASIQDAAVDDSAYQTAPLQSCASQSCRNSVTYASIQDADGTTPNGLNSNFAPARSHVTYASIQDEQQQPHSKNGAEDSEQHKKFFYGENNRLSGTSVSSFQQGNLFKKQEETGSAPVRAGIIHARSPSDSSSCTYASVSFPSEPKHYNTITDLGSRPISADDHRKSSGNVALGSFPNSNLCARNKGDDIYCGVEPYRANANGLDPRALMADRSKRNSDFSFQRREFERTNQIRPSDRHNLYTDISQQDGRTGFGLYTSIDATDAEKGNHKGDSVINHSSFHHKGDHANQNNKAFFCPQNDLHRFAVDRNSFQIDFCTCSDDHASSGGFGDFTSFKSRERVDVTTQKNNSNKGSDQQPTPPAGVAEVNQADYSPSSCKDCGRLIKQITYSESYSDETYEHAYSSRLLTRKGRRYSSPDITFSEISNCEFAQDPPSYLHYRSSPSWSRRSPANDARISRDDTWASSPRSDDVLPPAYGALDDNGFVSSHYERWSPAYIENRTSRCLDIYNDGDKNSRCTSNPAESSTAGQRKTRPWISVSPFTDSLFRDHNNVLDAKEKGSPAIECDSISAFSAACERTDIHSRIYPGEKTSRERTANAEIAIEKLEVVLPEKHTGLNTNRDCKTTKEPDRTSVSRPFRKGAKLNQAFTTGEVDSDDHEESTQGGTLVEQTDYIPDKNTKKLANYFQSLTASKEALVGSEDNILMPSPSGPALSDNPRCLDCSDAHLKSNTSAFTKLSTHSESFSTPKSMGSTVDKSSSSKEKAVSHYDADGSLGCQRSPDTSKSRHRLIKDNNPSTSTVGISKLEPALFENQNSDESRDAGKQGDKIGTNINDNNCNDNSNKNPKPQNKTDSGDTCYEFDISTSSEGEQQSSYDNLLSKVKISLNLEHEVQHIAESRAARRKKLLCRRCKKLGASSSNIYSIIDDAARDADALEAPETESRFDAVDGGLGLMTEDGMCPHLSLKYGELRAMLDSMFVDQRAAILDCSTDQAAMPNPYSLKAGHGLHFCGQDLGSLPAALQQLCRECGCEIMTSDSESITTVYSGLQAAQPGTQMRMTSPGSGAHTHTPSCDSDDGTMADNSGESCDEDDKKFSDKDENTSKTSRLTGHSYTDRGASKTSMDATKLNKSNRHRSVVSGSSNNGSIHSSSNRNDEADNSSGYDEPPEEDEKHQVLAQRCERSTHRTKKKEKRERKSSSAHGHNHSGGCTCSCPSDSRSTRRTSSQANAPGHSSRLHCQHCTACSDISRACAKQTGVSVHCACSTSCCVKHSPHKQGHQQWLHSHQEKHHSRRGGAQSDVYATKTDNDHYHFNVQQNKSMAGRVTVGCSSVSEKALKDIYSPLPAKALCLLTSRHSNNNSNNNINDNDGIDISSNTSDTSTSSIAGNAVLCTCSEAAKSDRDKGTQQTAHFSSSASSPSSLSSQPAPAVPFTTERLNLEHYHKETETSAKDTAVTKDQDSQAYSMIRETGSSTEVEKEKKTNEAADENRGGRTRAQTRVVAREGEGGGEPSDNGVENGVRVNAVQTHWCGAQRQSSTSQTDAMGGSGADGGHNNVDDGGDKCCRCSGSLPPSDDSVLARNSLFSTNNGGCSCESNRKMKQDHPRHEPLQYPHDHHNHHHHHLPHHVYDHYRSGKDTSVCASAERPPAAIILSESSHQRVSETSVDSEHSPSHGWGEENANDEGMEKTGKNKGKYFENKHRASVSCAPMSKCASQTNNTNNNSGNYNRSNVNTASSNADSTKGKTCKDEPPLGKLETEKRAERSGELGLSEDERTGGRIATHGVPATIPPNKPHTKGTTGETALAFPLLYEAGAEAKQCEKHCGQQRQCEHCLALTRKAGFTSPASKAHAIPTSACMQIETSGSAPASCSGPAASSPTVKAKMVIPRKHIKLELATLDLLPETALGSDMNEPEIDEVKQTTPEPTRPKAIKPKPNDRPSSVVQKIAKLFEENAYISNKTINKQAEDCCHKVGQNNIGPSRVQRSSGEALPAARASLTSTGTLDVTSEKEADPAGEASAGSTLLQSAPPSQRVSLVESSPDFISHRGSEQADAPRLTFNEKPLSLSSALPKPRARSKPSPDTSISVDCAGEKKEGPGVDGICAGYEKSLNNKPSTSETCLKETTKEDDRLLNIKSSLHRADDKAEYAGQGSENTSKDVFSKPGIDKVKGFEENKEHERQDEKPSEVLGKTHAPPKTRGSRLKHSDLLLRLKNAKDRSGGVGVLQGNPEDSSSASSSPSSIKKTTGGTIATTGSVDGGNQDVTSSPAGQHQGKQKRYSKKPHHKRRSKSRSARRRSGGKTSGDKEERTYYYFSSDLSDIDVMEVDDWETYATSMSTKKPSHQTRNNAAKLGAENSTSPEVHVVATESRSSSKSLSKRKMDNITKLNASENVGSKSQASEVGASKNSFQTGKRSGLAMGGKDSEEKGDEDVTVREERKPYSRIPAVDSPSSSPQASPELPKPRRSACATGGGKSSKLELYKTKRNSIVNNSLLSEMIIRNYDMQIYGNV